MRPIDMLLLLPGFAGLTPQLPSGKSRHEILQTAADEQLPCLFLGEFLDPSKS